MNVSSRGMAALAALSALSAALFSTLPAHAATTSFTFSGSGVSGSLTLTYGSATDAKYPNAFEVTAISGSFTDTNNGLNIVNTPILGLVAINRATPEPTNLLAPNDFSRYAVASGLAPIANGFLTYDNLYWPGGSSPTASDYPFGGGVLDIYGLMFQIAGGRVVNFWSNGIPPGATLSYGVAVATSAQALDYVGEGVAITAVPEPAAGWMLGAGLAGLAVLRRQRAAAL